MRRHANVVNLDEIETWTPPTARPMPFGGVAKRVASAAGGKKLGATCFIVPAGRTAVPMHAHHNNEEAIFILRGRGTLRVGTEKVLVRDGDWVALPAGEAHAHQLLADQGEELQYLVISTMYETEVVTYPDSGKIMAAVGAPPAGMRKISGSLKAMSIIGTAKARLPKRHDSREEYAMAFNSLGGSMSHAPLLSGRTWNGHMNEFRRDRFGLLDRFNDECGAAGKLRFFAIEILVANSPELARDVLVDEAKRFDKSPVVRAALFPLAGNGLFTSDGDLWRRQRRLMAPLFTPGPIARFADAMVTCAERSARALGDADGAVVDVAREMTTVTMAIAGKTLFDVEMGAESSAIGDALTVALDWADDHAMSTRLALQMAARRGLLKIADGPFPGRLKRGADRAASKLESPVLWPGERSRELRAAIALLDDRVQRMIDERRASASRRDDLLSRLLSARDDENASEAMSDRQLRDEILTLFVAGHETTATGLAWSLYLLARHPEARARARAEVDALGPRSLTADDLRRLPFVTGVFQEALRLYPPVYFIERVATADVQVGPYRVPSGGIVLISPYILHRRPEVWPDPLRFDPERFAPGANANRDRLAWLPFGAGPRVCIGQGFAMLEGPLVLATLLARVELALEGGRTVLPEASATLRPKGGVPMRVRRRRREDEATVAVAGA